MMCRVKILMLCLGVSYLLGLSQTSADEGFYIGGQGGVTFAQDGKLQGPGAAPDVRTNYSVGWNGGGFFGYTFGPVSTEIEVTHRKTSVKRISIITDGGLGSAIGFGGALAAPSTLTPSQGQTTANSVMLNIYYNFRNEKTFSPFIGMGAGVSRVRYKNIQGGLDGGMAPLAAIIGNQRNTVFTAQAIVGFRQKITEHLSTVLSYRYTYMADASMTLPTMDVVQPNYGTHSVMFGFSYLFSKMEEKPTSQPKPVTFEPRPELRPVTPPPPIPEAIVVEPQPVPQPQSVAIPGPFLIFFDWDSAVLNTQALATIREAAQAYHQYGIARIIAVGHTDRSGPNIYNDGLSVRRADAVKRALINQGIVASIITIDGRGENQLRVFTDDGVRERQNRRVEVTLLE